MLGTLIVAVVLRYQYINFVSSDYDYFLKNWVWHIRRNIMLEAYGNGLDHYNYTPLYGYFLGLFDFYFPTINSLYTVKAVTFIGEIFAACWVYSIMALCSRDKPASTIPALSVALFLLCPSVIDNGSIMGQCDIWFTAFMLAALYYVMRHRSAAAFVFGGLAFAFKPQAVFLAPFMLVLLLRKDLKWKYLWIIPFMYVSTCIPAWLEGRSASSLLMIYWSQIRGNIVSHSAANPYFYLNDSSNGALIRKSGEWIAAFIAIALVWHTYKRWHSPLTPSNCLILATLFAAIMPFVLPLMHDRYFFMADILSLLLACMKPRWCIPVLLLQSASLIALPSNQFPQLPGLPGWIQSLGMFNATLMNAMAIILLLWLCHHNLWTRPQKISNQVA